MMCLSAPYPGQRHTGISISTGSLALPRLSASISWAGDALGMLLAGPWWPGLSQALNQLVPSCNFFKKEFLMLLLMGAGWRAAIHQCWASAAIRHPDGESCSEQQGPGQVRQLLGACSGLHSIMGK